ncbi:alpha-amylase [Mycena polygramma]|nr:alpha-amylase [Mycena polygramma]
MPPSLLAVLSLLILVSPALAASAADWSTRSIYQLVTDRFAKLTDSSSPCDSTLRTYCGGSWAGIASHLDYIQDMGFDAVWISPIVANVDKTAYGDGYHGYWSRDIDTLNPHFGSAADLKALSDAVHVRGMFLMLDVVVNHYAGLPTNTTPSPSSPGQFTFDYAAQPPFTDAADYHAQCFITDYANQTDVEQCWLGDAHLPLPDLDTEDPSVSATLNAWIRDTVKAYDVDGVRIDTVKHIRHDFWAGYTASAGVFTLGEVLTNNATYAASYLGAVDGVFDYPAWYCLTAAFASPNGDLAALAASPALASLASSSSASTSSSGGSSAPVTAAFLENHDQPRFPSFTSDVALQRNAMAWVFVGDGIPVLYYGQEQGYQGGGDPYNREALWLSAYETTKPGVALVTALNTARRQAMAADGGFLTTPLFSLPPPHLRLSLLLPFPCSATIHTYSLAPLPLPSFFSLRPVALLAPGASWRIPAGVYASGTVLVDVLACRAFTVGGADGSGSGETVVQAEEGMPRVLLPAGALTRAGGACPALASGATRGGGREGRVSLRRKVVLGVMGTVVWLGGLV